MDRNIGSWISQKKSHEPNQEVDDDLSDRVLNLKIA